MPAAPLSLPSYEDFARLRLDQFLPPDHITDLTDWEYLGHYWVGQGCSFTSMLQLESDPSATRAVDLEFEPLELWQAQAILDALGLPLRPGMSADEIKNLLGQPETSHTLHLEYTLGPPTYHLSCITREDEGLIFVTMHTELPEPED